MEPEESGAGRVKRHAGPVSCVDMRADGLLVSGGYDAALRLWSSSGRSCGRLVGHGALVNAVRFAPDGARVASASSDRTTRVWDVGSGRATAVIEGHADDVNAVCWSPEGERLATASFDGTARIHDARDGALRAELRGHEADVNGVAWQPGGERLATASDDHTVRLWRDDGELLAVLRGHEDWVDAVAFSPDGRLLASAGLDGVACVWDADSGAKLAHLDGHGCTVKAVAFSPDGTLLATAAYDKLLRVFEVATWREVARVHDARMWNRSLAWGRAGALATGSFGGTPVRWRLGEEAARTADRVGAPGINGMALSPDGRLVALASDDGGARLLELASGRILRERFDTGGALLSAAFSPDGRRVAFGGWDDRVLLYDVDAPRPVRVLPGCGQPVNAVAFSADGRRLALGGFMGALAIFDAASGTPLGAPVRHRGSIKAVAAHGPGFLTCGRDGRVRIHDPVAAERAVCVGETILNAVAPSPDGRFAATASRGCGVLWLDLERGRVVAASRAVRASARCVAVSPDGRTVAAGHYDGHLQLFEPATGAVRTSRPFGATPLSGLAFRAGGRELVVASWSADGRLGVVDAASGEAKPVFALAGRGL